METLERDALTFASIIKKTKLESNFLRFGSFYLNFNEGVIGKLWWNYEDWELIKRKHDYNFPFIKGSLEISLQLCANMYGHYKFRAATRFNKIDGVTFSVNLTTQKETDSIIYLTNKIKFSERYEGNKELAEAHRRQKQIVFCQILKKLGIEVTENNDIILGIFDPKKKKLVNTSPEKFLEDFLIIAILKGHFMGNKGYELEIIPSFTPEGFPIVETTDTELVPKRIVENKSKRNIPLAFRYQILTRDKSRCVKCGFGPKDGVKLHIDHKITFSLGGLTEINNLQTLCLDCNISKSNRFID